MSQELSQEQLIRSYFLGDLPEVEQEQIQERLFTDREFFEALLMIEGELVDEYALGLISDQERAKLERGLLMSPHEYRKVEFVKTLDRYIANTKVAQSNAWAQLLREAKTNRDLIVSLRTDNWLGLELLLQLRSVPRATRNELASEIKRETAPLTTALSRLTDCELVHESQGKYSCSPLGLEVLEKLPIVTGPS